MQLAQITIPLSMTTKRECAFSVCSSLSPNHYSFFFLIN